jgi:hypothetical protein
VIVTAWKTWLATFGESLRPSSPSSNAVPVGSAGRGRSGRSRYSLIASTDVRCNGNSRDLPNFPALTISTPDAGSKSYRSSANASPRRMPVTASTPINVRIVAARCAGRSVPATSSNAVISASV